IFFFFFFFSSRRRHTRFSRDWSSDVCSSDLRSEGGVTGLPSTTPGCESNEEPRTPRFNPEGNAARKSDLLLSNNPEIRLVSQSVPFFVKAPITPGSAVLNNCITELPFV